jgi:hypothetical protein
MWRPAAAGSRDSRDRRHVMLVSGPGYLFFFSSSYFPSTNLFLYCSNLLMAQNRYCIFEIPKIE